jgi:membrane associated rhomboid family serine protease
LLAGAGAAAYLGKSVQSDWRQVDIQVERTREPIFNIPPVMLGLAACLCFIHLLVAFVLPAPASETVLELFAFEPLRYYSTIDLGGPLPGGFPADIWTFVTYAFLHANWTHLIVNLVWLVAFGTPVARRFGTRRFLAFFAFTAATGALAHLISHIDENVPVVGASAAVMGMMAAMMRFVFQPGAPLGFLRLGEAETYRVPAKSLAAMLRDPRMLLFTAVWFGLISLSGLPFFSMLGIEVRVAWQAHIGGFVGGLLAFAAFDPVPPAPTIETGHAADAQSTDDETPSR